MAMTKRSKTTEGWEHIITQLSPDSFEHLCYQLIRALPGFANVDLREGSSDSGRDIEAEYRRLAPDGFTEISEKWWFQCKRYSSGISYDNISGSIFQAETEKVDVLTIMSNVHLTPSCKNDIKQVKSQVHCRILDWTGVHFQDLLFSHPDICQVFFPDEEIPQHLQQTTRPTDIVRHAERTSSHFGIEFSIPIKQGQKAPQTIQEAADTIKEWLLALRDIDLNMKALLCHQISGLFWSLNRTEDAVLFINESLRITPNNVSALLFKGFILEKSDHWRDSAKCYDQILSIDPDNKFALNNKAHNLARSGQFKKALPLIDKALELDPRLVIAIRNKGSLLTRLGLLDEALDFLDTKLKDDRDSAPLLRSKVDLLIELMDFDQARKIGQRILEADPSNVDTLNNMGVIFEHNASYQYPQKYLALAIEWFEKAIQVDKDYALAWSNKIACLTKGDQLQDAELLTQEAMRLFPIDANILHRRGWLLLSRGGENNAREALKYFEKALNSFVLVQTMVGKAQALFVLRQYQKAIDASDAILKFDAQNADAWLIKGKALGKLHQKTRANQCFQKSQTYRRLPRTLLE